MSESSFLKEKRYFCNKEPRGMKYVQIKNTIIVPHDWKQP